MASLADVARVQREERGIGVAVRAVALPVVRILARLAASQNAELSSRPPLTASISSCDRWHPHSAVLDIKAASMRCKKDCVRYNTTWWYTFTHA